MYTIVIQTEEIVTPPLITSYIVHPNFIYLHLCQEKRLFRIGTVFVHQHQYRIIIY
jgi:hypothetical protein